MLNAAFHYLKTVWGKKKNCISWFDSEGQIYNRSLIINTLLTNIVSKNMTPPYLMTGDNISAHRDKTNRNIVNENSICVFCSVWMTEIRPRGRDLVVLLVLMLFSG